MSRSQVMYAHFPGGGPPDRTCRECRRFVPRERGIGGCGKAAEMAGLNVEEVHPIFASTRACKHFAHEEAPSC